MSSNVRNTDLTVTVGGFDLVDMPVSLTVCKWVPVALAEYKDAVRLLSCLLC